MATETVTTPRPPLSVRLTAGWLDRETILGYFLLTPALVILVLFLAYPFLYGIWLSLTNAE
ncbi:MAG TPA: sugar ABC transporter permease, partial [Candidatus Binatia bacterium]|nr:sugar ABC transporter permease [Candidatus Binatia bacterium]